MPKPIMVQYCREDQIFPLKGQLRAHEKLSSLYKKANAPQNYLGIFYQKPFVPRCSFSLIHVYLLYLGTSTSPTPHAIGIGSWAAVELNGTKLPSTTNPPRLGTEPPLPRQAQENK